MTENLENISESERTSEEITLQFIQYCQAKHILNEECDLSTIESLRRSTPKKAQTKLDGLIERYGEVYCLECPKQPLEWNNKNGRYYCPSCERSLNM